MAYSLNPKDLREELQTYKQPVYVASTQPAQTQVAPASTSSYRMQKRNDGGTDFYKGDKKTTIEDYSQGTGNKTENVRGYLANQGNKQEQAILTKQYFETKDPEVSKFNQSDVFAQRKRIADLKGLAERTQFNSQEDIKNRDWAKQQLANVEAYGKKQTGNPLTFVQDIADATVGTYKRATQANARVLDDLTVGAQRSLDESRTKNVEQMNQLRQQLLDKYSQGPIAGNPVDYMTPQDRQLYEGLGNKLAQEQATQLATSQSIQEEVDPTKAAGAYASIGLDVATAGAGSKLINSAVKGGAKATPTVGSKLIAFKDALVNPQTIKQGVTSGATLGTGYGVANTAEQLGSDATLADYAQGGATGALVGGLTGGAVPTVISGVKAAGKGLGIKSPTARMTDNMNIDVKAEQSARQLSDELASGDPTLQASLQKVQDNEAKIYELQSRGLVDNAPDIVRLRNEATQAENFAQNRFKTLSDEQYTKNLELERSRLKTEQRASERASGKQELQDVNQQLREFVPGGTLDASIGKGKDVKQKQLEIINTLNPMIDTYHTGIRSTDDIKTYKEAYNDPESFAYPDFSKADAKKAMDSGKITIYSSKPLDKNEAQFVTPSKMGASDYAGGERVYSKEVDVNDVAWINGDEGQLVGKIEPAQVTKTPKNDWRNTYDALKLSGKNDATANTLSEKQQILRSITQVSKSDTELSDVIARAEQLHKQGWLGDNANLAYDVSKNPSASATTKARATKLYEDIIAPKKTNKPQTPKQPATQKSAFEADLEAAGLKPTAKSKFANTVQRSREVSDPLKAKVKESQPRYDVTTDEARIAQSEQYLKTQGLGKATTDIKQRLVSDKIDDQTVSDAIATAKRLDAKGNQKSLTEASEIYEQLAEHLSKAGQTVQAAAILTRRTPEGLKYHAQKMLKKAGVELTPERQKALDGYISEVRKAQDQLNKLKSGKASKADIAAAEEASSIARENVQYYIATQIPAKLADKIINFWRAGLLTAPTTTGGAVLGNTETLLTRKLWTNPASAMADWTMSIFTGKRTQSLAKPGELGKGAIEGGKALNGQYWKTGRDAMIDGQRLGKYDQPNQKLNYGQKPLGKAVGGYVNGVYSLMGAVDKPFRYGAYRESLSSQARASIDTMRLKDKKINRQEARKLYNEMMDNPSMEMKQRATDEALYETFQNKTIAGDLIGSMKQWAKREGHSKTAALMDFLMPFTGVPSSIAARVIQRTPIGTASEIVKQIVNVKKNGGNFDQRAMARAIGEGTAGIPVIAAGAALASTGAITGGYPRDEKTRNEWEQTGKQPNSILINGEWQSLNYLQPFGTLLAIGSAIGEAQLDEKSIQDVILTGVGTASNSVVSMSFLDGISNALSVVTEGASESSVGRFVGNTAASIIPNFIRSATRSADDVQRDTKGDNALDTTIKSVAGALPGTRQMLPVKTDQFGKALPAKNNFLNQFLNPLRPSQSIGQDDPSVQELSRLLSIDSGVKPTEATKTTFKDHELKYSEIKDLNQLAGPKMKEEYDKLIQSPEYAKLSDEDKVKALKKVNDVVFGAIKAQWGYDKGYVTEEQLKELDSNQRRYAQGNGANYITGGIGDTKLDANSNAYKFLDSKPEMTDEEKSAWSQSEVSQEYQPLIDEFNTKLPEGLPKLPYTNKTAELLAEFQKDKADNNWSNLELNDKTKDLAINTYKGLLTDNEKFITTLSDANIVNAVETNQISQEELDRIIAIDDITTKLGGSQIIGNKTRKALGYGTIASGSGGKSSGAKKNYKLNAFGDVSGEVSGNLRKLIEQATIKGV